VGFWRSLSSGEDAVALNFDEREIEPAADLARRLGLPFTRLSLLTRALTHRSYVNEHPEVLEDNERLEFLGDAVLDFIAGAWVYHRFPEMPEGDLTKMRSALVRNDRLATFARRLEIGRALRLGRGEIASGGRARDSLLGSAFEAIIGALYLEAGIGAVETFIHPLFEEARDTILTEVYDPKSMFQEWAQSQKLGTPHYRTVSAHGPDHAKIFEVEVEIAGQIYGRGSGPSKQAAEHAAAQNAMEKLGLK
jgi:ribonuclease-3